MTRSAFLSSAGDPFLGDFCLSLWKNRWYHEIDTIYIGYNNHAEIPLQTSYEFLRKWEKDPKVRIIYTPMGIGNGNPITQMLFNSKEDSLLLLEDDGYIFTPGVVNEWFNLIESGKTDMIGSPRYTAGKIGLVMEKKYNLDYKKLGDCGFGAWPNTFLCKRSDLLKTDLDFGSTKYPKGKYFKELDYTMENDEYTDTFTFAFIQLRSFGLTMQDIPQYHTHPEDFLEKDRMYLWEEEPTYLHGGSLSSGWNGYLQNPPIINTDMEIKDMETRVSLWKLVSDETQGYEDFKIEYRKGIEQLIAVSKLNPERIMRKYNGYKRLMRLID